MWLKRLVGISMIITLIGMNGIVFAGFFGHDKNAPSLSLSQVAPPPTPPVVTLKADPPEVSTGLFSTLSWTVTGEITGCTASGDWSGPKTQFGSESTGRLAAEGTKTYTLTCQNAGGKATASTTVSVKQGAVAVIPTATKSSGGSTAAAPVHCGGASPCYGPRDVASHGGAGNCWGYNGDRVINITSLDAGFHKGKGISSIEISGVCGKNLSSALNGGVAADGQTRDHNPTTKSNADRNVIPYLVGYYDASKP